MNENSFEKVIHFINNQRSWANYDFPLERTTKVELDLGITGFDGVDFIVAYGKQFNVDVSKFMAADYFGAEGQSIFSVNNASNKKALTLGDLEKGIIAGRLDDEIINSPSSIHK